MVKIKKILGTSTVSLASLGLVLGMVGSVVGAQTGTIDTTGPDSENEIMYEMQSEVEIDNDNDLSASNNNVQTAESGEAEVEDNTTGGDAETGMASNETSFEASVVVDNSAGLSDVFAGFETSSESLSGSIENTGPDSENVIKAESEVEIDIENDNNLTVTNNVTQIATSGDAEVEDNTTGGSAVTGDVSNTSETSITFRVSN